MTIGAPESGRVPSFPRRRGPIRAAAWATPLAVFAILWCAATPLHAQSISGSVRAAGPTEPLGITLVLATDSLGASEVSRLTSDEGSFVLPLPRPGTWIVRAERLGYGTAGDTVVVEADQRVRIELVLDPDPIELRGIDVGVEPRCPPESGSPQVARLWKEARAILGSVGDATSPSRARFRVATELRRWQTLELYDPEDAIRDDRGVWLEASDTVWVEGPHPIVAPEPEQLLESGFIRPAFPGADTVRTWFPNEIDIFQYDAPSPALLLSDEFLATHCFSVDEDSDGHVGLRFEPDRFAVLDYDLKGVIWLPERPDVWPFIEFKHTPYPREDELLESPLQFSADRSVFDWRRLRLDERFGGRMDLAVVPEYGWIVHRFEMTWPVIQYDRSMPMWTSSGREKAKLGRPLRHDDYTRPDWSVRIARKFIAEVLEVQVGEGGG